MLTIQEARVFHPSTARQIPRGATFEYSEENLLRALEEADRAAEQRFTRLLFRHIDQAACAVLAVARNIAGSSQPIVATKHHGSD